MINGQKVTRPIKAQLSADIATSLGIPVPAVSEGASVDSTFLDAVFRARFGTASGGTDTYRKTERLLRRFGLTYDPFWDTSEAAPKGGGTVTARAYSRIRSAISGTPRTFILSVSDADITTLQAFRYDKTARGYMALNDAGPGSRVILYATATGNLVGSAEVSYIHSGWQPPWEANLTAVTPFGSPVAGTDVTIPGWATTDGITEISWETYEAIVNGGGEADPAPSEETRSVDPGGDVIAERVREDFPVAVVSPTVHVPDNLPRPPRFGAGPQNGAPASKEDGEAGEVTFAEPMPKRTDADRRRDKEAELRAIELAKAALIADGWTLDRDCQSDGVGYDLRFVKGPRRLNVEVKGIQGEAIVFNLTPREYWCAQTDDDWVLVPVTRVLSPEPVVNLVLRDEVISSPTRITGYRVTLRAPRTRPRSGGRG